MEAAAPSAAVQGTDAYEEEHRFTQAGLTGNRSSVIGRGNSVNRRCRGLNGKLFPLLYLAANHGHTHVVALLLDHDATVDAPSSDGSTALQGVRCCNHLASMRLLVARGAVVNRPRNDGCTALFAASHNGHVAVVQFLIAQRAFPEIASYNGESPLIVASAKGNLRVIKLRLAAGAFADPADVYWADSLSVASRRTPRQYAYAARPRRSGESCTG